MIGHAPSYWFLLGFLASEATDAAAVAAFIVALVVIIRRCPHKIGQFQRVADALYRRSPRTRRPRRPHRPPRRSRRRCRRLHRAARACRPRSGCSNCKGEDEDEALPSPPFPCGQKVVFDDAAEGAYGAIAGVVKSFYYFDGALYYNIQEQTPAGCEGEGKLHEGIHWGYVAAGGLIPEGAKVMFQDGAAEYRSGVTFKALVEKSQLVYVVEHAVPGDVKQTEVGGHCVWQIPSIATIDPAAAGWTHPPYRGETGYCRLNEDAAGDLCPPAGQGPTNDPGERVPQRTSKGLADPWAE